MPGVGHRRGRTEAEVDAVDHRIHAGHETGRARTTAASSPLPTRTRSGAGPKTRWKISRRERSLSLTGGGRRCARDRGRTGQLDADAIARQDADAEAAHLAGHVPEDHVVVVQLDAEHRVGERLDDLPLELDLLFLGHGRHGPARGRSGTATRPISLRPGSRLLPRPDPPAAARRAEAPAPQARPARRRRDLRRRVGVRSKVWPPVERGSPPRFPRRRSSSGSTGTGTGRLPVDTVPPAYLPLNGRARKRSTGSRNLPQNFPRAFFM